MIELILSLSLSEFLIWYILIGWAFAIINVMSIIDSDDVGVVVTASLVCVVLWPLVVPVNVAYVIHLAFRKMWKGK